MWLPPESLYLGDTKEARYAEFYQEVSNAAQAYCAGKAYSISLNEIPSIYHDIKYYNPQRLGGRDKDPVGN